MSTELKQSFLALLLSCLLLVWPWAGGGGQGAFDLPETTLYTFILNENGRLGLSLVLFLNGMCFVLAFQMDPLLECCWRSVLAGT